jgi:hypothetical protein
MHEGGTILGVLKLIMPETQRAIRAGSSIFTSRLDFDE